MTTPARTLVLFSTLALAACSSEVAVGSNDGSVDTGTTADLGTDAGPVDVDLGTDAGPHVDAGPPSCTTNADCDSGQYCQTAVGACAGPGVCAPFDPTSSCDVTPDLVCGCDGHTYNNTCAATRAGVAVDHFDTCPVWTTGCISDLDCDGGDFCELPDGSCGGSGTCTWRGIGALCADTCEPECGCDGTTYQNACLRRKAAVSLQQSNTCPGDPPPCTMGGACCSTTTDCATAQECVGAAGPTPSGKCLPIMGAPDCWIDDDCGVGHTCMDPYFCPCGSTCPRPDTPGTCV